MKVLITGIAGFAGSHLADLLLDQGYEVGGISHPDFPLDNLQHCLDKLKIFKIDITSFKHLETAIRQSQPEYIFHLAAISSVSHSWEGRELVFNTNIKGSFNLLEACRNLKKPPHFLLVSSGEVYGPILNRNNPAQESQPYNPINPYAATKAAMEMLGRQYATADDLPIYIARSFNHSGPRQSTQFVCSSFAKQIAEIELKHKEPKLFVGNLAAERDFSDVRDIVNGYLKIVQNGKAGEIYNLCSGRAVSIEDILQMLCSYSKKKIEVIKKKSLIRRCDIPLMLGDNTKAKRELQWKREIELEQTLLDLLSFWRDQLKSGNM